jgi:hypothetical protein
VQQKYMMTDNAYKGEKLGGSNTDIALQGCFVVSMANTEFSYKGSSEDLVLKISTNPENFGDPNSDKFNMRQYGMDAFGSPDMGEVLQGKAGDNSLVTNKLSALKESDKTYAVFGLFSTAYGDHMVPVNDTAENGSFAGSIIKSSANDTNYDNRFDSENLVGIRYFEVQE